MLHLFVTLLFISRYPETNTIILPHILAYYLVLPAFKDAIAQKKSAKEALLEFIRSKVPKDLSGMVRVGHKGMGLRR